MNLTNIEIKGETAKDKEKVSNLLKKLPDRTILSKEDLSGTASFIYATEILDVSLKKPFSLRVPDKAKNIKIHFGEAIASHVKFSYKKGKYSFCYMPY